LRFTYDDEADALYVMLNEGVEVTRSVVVDDDRVIDVDDEGRSIGIEVLGASHGVNLLDLVEQFGLQIYVSHLEQIEKHHFHAIEFA
jgi:uncharacterized protein YuzE